VPWVEVMSMGEAQLWPALAAALLLDAAAALTSTR
jgi:hypothetical protein